MGLTKELENVVAGAIRVSLARGQERFQPVGFRRVSSRELVDPAEGSRVAVPGKSLCEEAKLGRGSWPAADLPPGFQ